MRIWVSVVVLCLLLLPGCMVSKKKYTAAVADMESAKAELEKSRMHRDALDNQIKNLKGTNDQMSRDLEVLTSEVQRIKEGCQNEKALLEARQKELHQEQQVLLAKFRTLNDEYRKLKGQSKALKDTVIRYQKELKEARQKKSPSLSPPPKPNPSSLLERSPSRPIPSESKPMGSPERVEKLPPQKAAVSLVNINRASVNDLVLFLGLSKEMAQDLVDNRPYRLRGELVARKVVPKATFDVIKDRMTAVQ